VISIPEGGRVTFLLISSRNSSKIAVDWCAKSTRVARAVPRVKWGFADRLVFEEGSNSSLPWSGGNRRRSAPMWATDAMIIEEGICTVASSTPKEIDDRL
jgi:hypothetical protein